MHPNRIRIFNSSLEFLNKTSYKDKSQENFPNRRTEKANGFPFAFVFQN